MAKARILVIEDEAFIAANIESILEKNGYQCVGLCRDTATAETFLRAATLDAVLMDVIIHDQTSFEFCGLLAALNIPFGFVTGIPQDAIRDEWQDRPFCPKPFSDDDIVRLVEQLLHQSAGASANAAKTEFLSKAD